MLNTRSLSNRVHLLMVVLFTILLLPNLAMAQGNGNGNGVENRSENGTENGTGNDKVIGTGNGKGNGAENRSENGTQNGTGTDKVNGIGTGNGKGNGAENRSENGTENGTGNGKVIGTGNGNLDSGPAAAISSKKSPIKGLIKPNQHIYYQGDTLEIDIKFPRGGDLLSDGTLDVHVVIFGPEGNIWNMLVDPDDFENTSGRRFFFVEAIDTDEFPTGQYQLGLIATKGMEEGVGDPADVQTWFNGLRGLLANAGVRISDEPVPEDSDMDGELDLDDDQDGFVDDDD